MNNRYLKHWGVLGMHWGVRRSRSSGSSSTISRKTSEDFNKVSSLRKKRLDEMSNEELKTLTTRMQLERQYKDLSKQDHSAATKFITEILTNTGKQVISSVLSDILKKQGSKLVTAMLGGD